MLALAPYDFNTDFYLFSDLSAKFHEFAKHTNCTVFSYPEREWKLMVVSGRENQSLLEVASFQDTGIQ